MLCRRINTNLAAAALSASVAVGLVAIPSASAAPVAAQSPAREYVVKDGDSLFGISQKIGAPLTDVLAANNLTVTSIVHPGQRLIVPTSATKVAPAVAAAPAPATYTVKAGDYLFGIARALGAPIADLLAANALKVTSVLQPGDTLVVPGSATNPAGTAATPSSAPAGTPSAGTGPSTYTVKLGDYLFGIARMYGITVGTLLQLNDLTISSVVVPGQALQIPAGAVAAPAAPVERAASGGAPASAGTTDQIDKVVAFARAQLGKPYKFNTAGPDTFDCSGLSAAAYAQIGIVLPHQSAMQSTRGIAVDWRTEDIQAGDLVFMYSSNNPGVISHLGIAVNSWQWIHAPRTGDVVRLGLIPSDDTIKAVRRYVTD